LTTHWQRTTVTDAAVATKVHKTLDAHRHFTTQVTFNGKFSNFGTHDIELFR
jgi:hypothetical protein